MVDERELGQLVSDADELKPGDLIIFGWSDTKMFGAVEKVDATGIVINNGWTASFRYGKQAFPHLNARKVSRDDMLLIVNEFLKTTTQAVSNIKSRMEQLLQGKITA